MYLVTFCKTVKAPLYYHLKGVMWYAEQGSTRRRRGGGFEDFGGGEMLCCHQITGTLNNA